jgi:transposase
VTRKFADDMRLYRPEDIFQRQGVEVSRATQSACCGDVADLVEPLYELLADRVRSSHVVPLMTPISTGSPTAKPPTRGSGCMWATTLIPTTFFTSRRIGNVTYRNTSSRINAKVLLADDAFGRGNGVVAGNEITRAGCRVGEDVATLTPHRSGRADFPASGSF